MKRFLLAISIVGSAMQAYAQINQSTQIQETMSFYDLKANAIDGKPVDFASFKGKYVIVLNVASECGYTPQYAQWEAFYRESKDSGVEVIGVPCNQFGGQEPGSGDQILQFCQKNYGVSFGLLEKCDVKGVHISPLYAWLTSQDINGEKAPAPNWNFCKYLISPEGRLIAFFPSKITPSSEQFIEALSH